MQIRRRNQPTFLRTVLGGVLIAFVGYLIFADKSVGNIQELGMIVFWAFGTDITVQAAVTAAQPLKRS